MRPRREERSKVGERPVLIGEDAPPGAPNEAPGAGEPALDRRLRGSWRISFEASPGPSGVEMARAVSPGQDRSPRPPPFGSRSHPRGVQGRCTAVHSPAKGVDQGLPAMRARSTGPSGTETRLSKSSFGHCGSLRSARSVIDQGLPSRHDRVCSNRPSHGLPGVPLAECPARWEPYRRGRPRGQGSLPRLQGAPDHRSRQPRDSFAVHRRSHRIGSVHT